ncbi:MAG: alpha/beta hydrolase [Deltaproteobacteria bacterium]|nr:alpha/beta hydrolase [Deltaproteobacteria bacterium]
MTLRYGAALRALQSLRGDPTIAAVQPTEAAVPYRAHLRGGIAPLVDIYLPARPIGASVVLVHGGAFVIGSRRMKPMRYLAARLVTAGIAVCAVDYRLIFRGGRLDEAVDDVSEALAFWAGRVPALGLDARAVSMVGLSAGASLGLLAAARTDRLASLVCAFGLYEIGHLRGPAGLLPRLLFRTADRATWHSRSPRFAAQPATRTLLLHGDDDGLVPVEQARRLAAHRESLGLPTRLVIYPGAPHGFFNLPLPAADAGVREIIDHVSRAA